MPRPSRINCAILRLSCAVTALMLPTAAKAQVTINSAYQYAFNSIHYGERPFGHVVREQRSECKDLDLFHTSTVSPGLRRIITTTKYRSTLVTGPTSPGTVCMAQRFDPGLVLLRDLNEASLSLWAQSAMSITFSNTLVAQVQLRAVTRIDSPEAFLRRLRHPDLPSQPITNPRDFLWAQGGPTQQGPISASLDHTITLLPGSWDMFIYTNITDLAANRESLAFPATINLDMSFAIIPAPAPSSPSRHSPSSPPLAEGVHPADEQRQHVADEESLDPKRAHPMTIASTSPQ